jgi:hypothetical protein
MKLVLFLILLTIPSRFECELQKNKTTFKKLKLYSFERQDKNIIIGDSQSPYVDWGSDKFELISKNSGVNSLWQSGKTLSWLLDAVNNYKKDTSITNVAICIGTNGAFNKNDKIKDLVNSLSVKFPNSKLFVVQGSWGWGGLKNKTEKQVRDYYLKFKDLGVVVIEPPIGRIEPHGRKPVYKKIGTQLDSLVIL